MKRLRKSDIRDLSELLPVELDKKADIQLDDRVLLVNGELWFFNDQDAWIPALPLLLKQQILPSVTVDMGAVRFVTRGADVMRPGITKAESFEADSAVVIVEETHGKPLAVARAKYGSEELMAMDSGVVLANLHYVGDKLWNEFKR